MWIKTPKDVVKWLLLTAVWTVILIAGLKLAVAIF